MASIEQHPSDFDSSRADDQSLFDHTPLLPKVTNTFTLKDYTPSTLEFKNSGIVDLASILRLSGKNISETMISHIEDALNSEGPILPPILLETLRNGSGTCLSEILTLNLDPKSNAEMQREICLTFDQTEQAQMSGKISDLLVTALDGARIIFRKSYEDANNFHILIEFDQEIVDQIAVMQRWAAIRRLTQSLDALDFREQIELKVLGENEIDTRRGKFGRFAVTLNPYVPQASGTVGQKEPNIEVPMVDESEVEARQWNGNHYKNINPAYLHSILKLNGIVDISEAAVAHISAAVTAMRPLSLEHFSRGKSLKNQIEISQVRAYFLDESTKNCKEECSLYFNSRPTLGCAGLSFSYHALDRSSEGLAKNSVLFLTWDSLSTTSIFRRAKLAQLLGIQP